jgi:hypothetical protein
MKSISSTVLPSLLCLVLVGAALGCTSGTRETDAGYVVDASGDDSEPPPPPPCTSGVDCAVCAPSIARCTGEDEQTPEVCNSEGTAWVSAPACDPSEGNVCGPGGACVPFAESAACREAASDTERSYLGCDFFSVTLAHAHLNPDTEFAIAIANPRLAPAWTRIEGGALESPMVVRVAPGELETVVLPYVRSIGDMPYSRGPESMLATGAAYRVTSSAPVSVTQFNPLSSLASADATMLFPTTALDTRYRILTTSAQGTYREHSGNFAIVGVSDTPTSVRVRPSAAIVSGPSLPAIPAGTERTFSLSRGDVLQLVAQSFESDLSGSTIEADAPVAVFSAHLCANLPGTACDHLEEQTFPTSAWGRRYAATSFGDNASVEFVVRILAGRDGTRVTFDPPSVSGEVVLDDGETFQLTTSGQFIIEGSAPILVAELVAGRGGGGEDPSLAYAVPVEQYRPQAIFLTAPEFDQSFVNLIGPRGQTPILDGAPVTVPSVRIGSSELAVWRVPLAGGSHTLGTAGDDTHAFGAMVYGFRPAGSYAYAAGLNQEVLQAPF